VKAVRTAFAAAALACAGCAQLPDATIRYYLARTTVSFKAARTVACDADGNLVSATIVTPTVVHAADRSRALAIPLRRLAGTFADTDLKVELYEDGRLKSVNAAGTGEAEPILKTVIAIAGAAAAMTPAAAGGRKPPTACERVSAAGHGKPKTLVYEGEVDVSMGPAAQALKPDPYAQALLDAIGGVCAYVEKITPTPAAFEYAARDGDVTIAVRPPGVAHVVVKAGGLDGGCDSDPVWQGDVIAAQIGIGREYALPIPKPPLFGKQVFAVTFHESGALASVQYASNAGTGSALDTLGAAVSGVTGAAAAKAAQLKAESDLIEQQERLVRCRADPASCK
jgi:hypothetical protein